jgi:hypothetical protein
MDRGVVTSGNHQDDAAGRSGNGCRGLAAGAGNALVVSQEKEKSW